MVKLLLEGNINATGKVQYEKSKESVQKLNVKTLIGNGYNQVRPGKIIYYSVKEYQ